MLDTETKRRIDSARDILVGKVPDPKAQVEQITTALIYKFMDDMDRESMELGGKARFFSDGFEQYSWTRIISNSLSGFDRLNLYSEAIQKMSMNKNLPQLFRDMFKGAFLPYRDSETLNLFLKEIDGFSYDHSEKLGDAFEYLLSVLGSQGDAGQFRTPRHIIDFMVRVVNPQKNDTILDPACGTAGFLISAYKHITNSNKAKLLTPDEKERLTSNFTGYDISPDMVKLSLVNMYLHNFPNPKIQEYDTLTSEEKWDDTFDVVLANPPFMSPKGGIRPHQRFSVKAKRSEVLFVDYIAEHLNIGGRAGIIVPEGIIFQSQNAYKELRKMLVEEHLYAVVSLPAGAFNPYSGVKTSILLMDKAIAKKSDNILFIKIENDGFDLGAQRRAIDKNNLPLAEEIIKEYLSICNTTSLCKTEELTEELIEKYPGSKIWSITTKEKIAESGDYNLSGERYKVNDELRISNYKLVELGDVCEKLFAGGDAPKDYTKTKTKDNTIPIYSNGTGHKSLYGYSNLSRVDKDAVTISARGTIGYARVRKAPFLPIVRLIVAIPNDNIIDLVYLKLILESLHIYRNGNSIPQLTIPMIRCEKIPLPPLEIQKEIVEEIEGYQKIIDGARQVVENYKPQIQIDPSWEMVELGEVCEVINGKAYKQEELLEVGKYPVLRVGNFFSNRSWYFSDLELAENKYCDNGDLLYAWSASFGPKIWDGGKTIYHYHIWKMVPNEKVVTKKFMYLILLNDTEKIKSEGGRGIAMIHITKGGIEKRKIPTPTLSLQNQIVEKVEDEQKLVNANKELITIFEQKIKDRIAKVWGE